MELEVVAIATRTNFPPSQSEETIPIGMRHNARVVCRTSGCPCMRLHVEKGELVRLHTRTRDRTHDHIEVRDRAVALMHRVTWLQRELCESTELWGARARSVTFLFRSLHPAQ